MILFISYLVGKRWLGALSEYLNGRSRSIAMPTDAKRSVTSTYQDLVQHDELAKATYDDER